MYLFPEDEALHVRLNIVLGAGVTQKSAWFGLQLQHLKMRRLHV